LIEAAEVMQIEGAQGYSLSIDHGFWPYVTSRSCTTIATMAACGLPPLPNLDVIGTMRTFPIRVADRFSEGGGSSGPCYPDQHEISWADIDRTPEITTVTKKERRIFTFSAQQVLEAMRQNRCSHTFLSFLDYIPEVDRGVQTDMPIPARQMFLDQMTELCRTVGSYLKYYSTGPHVGDMYERGIDGF